MKVKRWCVHTTLLKLLAQFLDAGELYMNTLAMNTASPNISIMYIIILWPIPHPLGPSYTLQAYTLYILVYSACMYEGCVDIH